MAVLYVVAENEVDLKSTFPGVAMKVQDQVACINRSGINCSLLFLTTQTSRLARVVKRLPFCPDGVRWEDIEDHITPAVNVIYFRKPNYFSKSFLHSLRIIKDNYQNIKIVVEIPTYPYDEEYKTISRYPLLIKDKLHRNKLFQYIDKIAFSGGKKSIFRVPVLNYNNGISLHVIKKRSPSGLNDNAIDMLCAASFAKWHGVDRLIAGLGSYMNNDPKRLVYLHLLGEGPALVDLKQQVNELGLSNYVKFYGRLNRERMDEVYDKCTLAIASLGLHRIGLSVASTLKTREYLAKGIPFVYSGEIDVFLNSPVDFCLKVPADETPVDIGRLVEFHDCLYSENDEVALINQIRRYAADNVSMDVTMRPVIDYMKEVIDE